LEGAAAAVALWAWAAPPPRAVPANRHKGNSADAGLRDREFRISRFLRMTLQDSVDLPSAIGSAKLKEVLALIVRIFFDIKWMYKY
jgi:hypothetical protein